MTEFDADRHAAEHERFARDDAAYLAGALDDDDAAAYEAHLSGCPLCQAQISELNGLTDRLLNADPSAFAEVEAVPDTLLPRLLREVRSYRRRQRVRVALAAGVAACLVLFAGVGGIRFWNDAHAPTVHHFTAANGGPATVEATVTLRSSKTGTSLRVYCGHYRGAPSGYGPSGQTGPQDQGEYRLVVINRAGSKQYPVSWPPGADIRVDAGSIWPPKAIKTIQIVDASGNPVLQVNL
ncbi:zf-HC2 domain-containing protein [Jatrophihabitans telluris]|uniref:Zf-HC2 domain-containing protein n=1 Tax=Jatrophihabitans telluris TaxID=2038343 RepID=A0ABY4QUW2_9ACTN|nr:zf-HC2 domain-containing protein [Jatrophihabitans telluris]UQX86656.1 zf-HC2 domain-containing protein [Jatrophihabitans telluris]